MVRLVQTGSRESTTSGLAVDDVCLPISPNPNSPNPYMLGLGIGLGLRLGIGLGSGFEYFRQYNVIRRIGIRRNGAEPS